MIEQAGRVITIRIVARTPRASVNSGPLINPDAQPKSPFPPRIGSFKATPLSTGDFVMAKKHQLARREARYGLLAFVSRNPVELIRPLTTPSSYGVTTDTAAPCLNLFKEQSGQGRA